MDKLKSIKNPNQKQSVVKLSIVRMAYKGGGDGDGKEGKWSGTGVFQNKTTITDTLIPCCVSI
jgi:hypothetical protein